jgi:hypothetical protein
MNVFARITRKLSALPYIVRAIRCGSEMMDSIEVSGRQEFRRAVTAALALLRDKNLPVWNALIQHVNSVLEGKETTIVVTAHPAFIFIDEAYAGQDPEYLAATIAHMACSCQLHRQYEADFPNRPVPRDIYAGSVAQERCEQAYRDCLRVLGIEAKG